MWVLLKSLLLRWALLRVLLGSLGSLAALIPIALLLLKLGWPVVLVLAAIGVPVAIVLALVGLPIVAIVAVTGALVGIVGLAITAGLGLISVLVPILLPIAALVMLLRWLATRPFRPGGDIG